MKNSVSLHDVLEVTNRIEDKLDKMEVRVSVLEVWRAEILGKLSVTVAVLTFAFTLSWEYIRERVFRGK